MINRVIIAAVCAASVWLGSTAQASAWTFHSFDVEELFSTADGKIQFVELLETEGMSGQDQFQSIFMTSIESYYPFPKNLPSSDTAFRRVLIATPDFIELCPGVKPDYVLPEGFISTFGDLVAIRETMNGAASDELAFGKGELPIDGVNSLYRNGTTGPNTPTNYWGQTCTLKVTSGVPAASTWGMMIMAIVLLGGGAAVLSKRRPGALQP